MACFAGRWCTLVERLGKKRSLCLTGFFPSKIYFNTIENIKVLNLITDII